MPSREPFLVVNARLWQGLATAADDSPRWLEVTDAVITSIGVPGQPAPPSGAREVIDVDGRLVLPGFVDTHTHLGWHAEDRWTVNWSSVTDRASALDQVRTIAQRVTDGMWLTGGDWLSSELADAELPTLAELDAASAGLPLFLRSRDHRIALVNSRAMALSRIDHETVDPAGGEIRRDDNGLPTGVLTGEAVWSRLAAGVVPPRNRHRQLAELRDLLADLVARGITEVHDIGTYPRQDSIAHIHEERSFTDVALIDELDRRDSLSLRYAYRASIRRVSEHRELVAARANGSALVEFGGYKMSLDNGWFSEPPGPRVDSFRYPGFDGASKLIERADREGGAVAIHAMGDLGVTEAVDLLSTVRSRSGTELPRHRVIHARRMAPTDIQRCAHLGIALEVQPWEIAAQGARLQACGNAEFAHGISPYASLVSAGCVLTFGSDRRLGLRTDQLDTDPLVAVQLAVTRQALGEQDGTVWQPEQRLTVEQALHCATTAGAVAAGSGSRRGVLAAGRQADLVVLDVDPRRVAADHIADARPVLTVSDGRIVFDEVTGSGR
jgi:predicted amidohydrolase YtcJ